MGRGQDLLRCRMVCGSGHILPTWRATSLSAVRSPCLLALTASVLHPDLGARNQEANANGFRPRGGQTITGIVCKLDQVRKVVAPEMPSFRSSPPSFFLSACADNKSVSVVLVAQGTLGKSCNSVKFANIVVVEVVGTSDALASASKILPRARIDPCVRATSCEPLAHSLGLTWLRTATSRVHPQKQRGPKQACPRPWHIREARALSTKDPDCSEPLRPLHRLRDEVGMRSLSS